MGAILTPLLPPIAALDEITGEGSVVRENLFRGLTEKNLIAALTLPGQIIIYILP